MTYSGIKAYNYKAKYDDFAYAACYFKDFNKTMYYSGINPCKHDNMIWNYTYQRWDCTVCSHTDYKPQEYYTKKANGTLPTFQYIKCECGGASTINSNLHSDWCPKYNK